MDTEPENPQMRPLNGKSENTNFRLSKLILFIFTQSAVKFWDIIDLSISRGVELSVWVEKHVLEFDEYN